MKPVGRHLIADIYDCDRMVLDDVEALRHAMLETTVAIRGTPLTHAFHKFEPQGVSGTVVIAESHLSIHTWPEHGYAAVDIFTCGGLDPCSGLEVLRNALSAGEIRCQEIQRGMNLGGSQIARPEDLNLTVSFCTLCHDRGPTHRRDPAPAGNPSLPVVKAGVPSAPRPARAPTFGLDAERAWFTEGSMPFYQAGSVTHSLRVDRMLCHERSSFQEIVILDNAAYGRVLLLDGVTQLSTLDERVYHEMLVHPAMLAHPSPRRVLVVGGGDGGSLREVLRHDPEEVVLVEIDPRVVACCRQHLPELSDGAFDDPRVRVRHEDAARVIEEYAGRFDVIIVDGSDDAGASSSLFGDRFFSGARRALGAGGLCALQGGAFFDRERLLATRDRLARHFPRLTALRVAVPSFHAGDHAFFLVGVDTDPRGPAHDVLSARLHDRGLAGRLRYYTADCHHDSQRLPPALDLG